jgi:uncharacterized membrane protein YedE/YeeE
MDGNIGFWLTGSAVVLGLLFGVVVQRSRFCMTAAVANIVLIRDYRQLHAYLAALAVALIGTQVIEGFDWVNIAATSYRGGNMDWAGAVLGGLIFGIGAVFAGGCVGRILVRTGEGSLGALLALSALAMGTVVAYVGILEPVRAWLLASTEISIVGGDASLAAVLGVPQWLLAFCFIGLLLTVLFVSIRRHGTSPMFIIAGVLIGTLVVSGWWATGYLLYDEFSVAKPVSLGFSGPVARTAIYLAENKTNGSFFSIALTLSVLAGAFISAVLSGTFKISSPDSAGIGRTLLGGFFMGVGAITAGGCNIGQGLTGMSTLSLESMLALIAIVGGMYTGVKWLQHAEETGSFWFTLNLFPKFHHQHRLSKTPVA